MVINGDFHIAGPTTKRPTSISSSCLATEFYCDDKCIPETWKCDNFNDCNDRTDEQFCGKKFLCQRKPENSI